MTKRIVAVAIFLVCMTTTMVMAGDNAGKAISLVDAGIAHIEAVGPDQAAKDFMNPKKAFIDGSYYLLFYKYDGTCIALGAKPQIAGKNRWNVKDPDGVYQVQEMIRTAKAGGGWVAYKYANPTTGKLQKKKTWVQPAPGMDAFVGCGIYY